MSDTPKFIQRQWEDFVEAVELEDAPPVQLREMRRAFFGGARAYSSLLLKYASETEEATDTDIAFMDALEAEMEAFARDVVEGRA